MDWSDCPLVEVIPGKASGVPLLKNTRLPVEAITGNYDAFRDEGLPPDSAMAETLDCYPEAGLDAGQCRQVRFGQCAHEAFFLERVDGRGKADTAGKHACGE